MDFFFVNTFFEVFITNFHQSTLCSLSECFPEVYYKQQSAFASAIAS